MRAGPRSASRSRARTGVATRRSETVGRQLMYVAVPGGPGVIRVAADLAQVDALVRRAQGEVAGAALLALLVGTVLALVAARSIAQPLSDISAAARAIAAGTPPRFPRSGIPEIDVLVQSLRQMHQQLGDRFAELRREQAESAALVESMVEGVIAADGRGHIVTANPAARRLLGYAATGSLPDLPALFRVKAAREVVDIVLEGRPVQDRQLDMDGRVFLVNARPLPAGGAVLVLHDLTEIRRLEAVRRDFVANVSHELKTPLTSISGYAETLLGDPPDSETTRRFLDDDPEQRAPDAAAGRRPARPVAHRVGALAAELHGRGCRRRGPGVVDRRSRSGRRRTRWSWCSTSGRAPTSSTRISTPCARSSPT